MRYLIGILVLVTAVSAKTYYATPSSNTTCPEEDVPCLTLSEYANLSQNLSNDYFDPNIRLVLLPGNHNLESRLWFRNNVLNLEVFAANTSAGYNTTVTCSPFAGAFNLSGVGKVHIEGITFVGCMENEVGSGVNHFTIVDCNFDGQGRNGTSLNITSVVFVSISRSSFSSNTGSLRPFRFSYGRIGGAIIIHNSRMANISDCLFTNNSLGSTAGHAKGGGALYFDSSTVVVYNSTFDSNVVSCHEQLYQDVYGGAMHGDSSMVTVSGCTVTDNAVNGSDFAYGGVMCFQNSTVTIETSTFTDNRVVSTGHSTSGQGGVLYAEFSNVTIVSSTFKNNSVTTKNNCRGGAVSTIGGTTIVRYSLFEGNTLPSSITGNGGAIVARTDIGDSPTQLILESSTFISNNVVSTFAGYGGAVFASGPLSAHNVTFTNNTVSGEDVGGGAVLIRTFKRPLFNCTLFNSTFTNNAANGRNTAHGGGVHVWNLLGQSTILNVTVTDSVFNNNTVSAQSVVLGGAFCSVYSKIKMNRNTFKGNKAIGNTGRGGAIYLLFSTLTSVNSLRLQNNMASSGIVYALQSEVTLSGSTITLSNTGSLHVFSSNLTIVGDTVMRGNFISDTASQLEGGAVTGIQSDIVFTGRASLLENTAQNGGAILALESKFNLNGNINFTNNTASFSGGGIYAYQSELNIIGAIEISSNTALNHGTGGGIHAVSSTTKLTGGSIAFEANHAQKGGGMYLELNAKLYIIKTQPECHIIDCRSHREWLSVQFTDNSAEYGGALYIANSRTCESTPYRAQSTASECFFQVLSLYDEVAETYRRDILNVLNTYFTNNTATVAGGSLYGGLLDRCTVSSFAEIFVKYPAPTMISGTLYLLNTTNLQLSDFNSTASISSDPVRVCFCRNSKPDCNFHPKPIYVKKGETFNVSLVAVDEVNNTLANSSIHASVSIKGGLSERQSVQATHLDGCCTNLTYNILSPFDSEHLLLYAHSPCGDSGISAVNIPVHIAPCPIGFNDSNMRCGCDPTLYPTYVSNCSIDTESVLRKDNSWFDFVNTTGHQAFTFHQYCPFDYCYPSAKDVSVNLNIPNGANALCAFNRSGKLCGSCEDGLSLSFGSSHCKECTNSWLALLIVFAVAGIALVTFILVFNLTVAVGTINGLIFYANIVSANRAIFLPFESPNFLTVFISWVNLDFGFETCFYDGMNGYQKTWLQFAFPLYVLFLVAMVIFVAEHSFRFAKILRMRTLNPIPTLATLILLSYAKFIRTIIASLSITTLEYSDGFKETVWLVDANVCYFSWKHSLLFVAAVVVLLVGLAYTSLLFLWQWLNYLYKKPAFKWVADTELNTFMETYHGPYNGEHRYWTGLLLLVRLILYIISALNVFGNPTTNLVSIICIFGGLYFLSSRKGRIYKEWPFNVLESSYLFNLILFAAITLSLRESNGNQTALAYTSTSIAFVTFVGTVLYHGYKFVLTKETCKEIKGKVLNHKKKDPLIKRSTTEATTKHLSGIEYVSCSESVVTEVDGCPTIEDTLEMPRLRNRSRNLKVSTCIPLQQATASDNALEDNAQFIGIPEFNRMLTTLGVDGNKVKLDLKTVEEEDQSDSDGECDPLNSYTVTHDSVYGAC